MSTLLIPGTASAQAVPVIEKWHTSCICNQTWHGKERIRMLSDGVWPTGGGDCIS